MAENTGSNNLTAATGMARSLANLKSRLQNPAGEVVIKTEPSKSVPGNDLEQLKKTLRLDLIYRVPLEWVDWDDKAFFTRTSEEELMAEEETSELIHSLPTIGQIVPCIVRFNEAGKIQIADGWRRSLSIRKILTEAGENKPGVLRDGLKIQFISLTPKEVIGLTTAVNFNRKDHTGYQKVVQIHKMMDQYGYSADEISSTTGFDRRWVYRLILLTKPENAVILDSLRVNQVSLKQAIAVAERTKDMRPEVKVKEVNKAAGENPAQTQDGAQNGERPNEEGDKAPVENPGGRVKKPKELSSYFIMDEGSGNFRISAKVNARKTSLTEIGVMIGEGMQFLSALRDLKKKLQRKEGRRNEN